MNLKIIEKDIFTLPKDEWVFAHCVSADFKMGKGIAPIFKKKFNLDLSTYSPGVLGQAIFVNGVFNLVTKEKYFHKPTYESLKWALINMAIQVKEIYIPNLAMPKIGTGLDKLSWNRVKDLIYEVFDDIVVNITVCKYNPNKK